MSHLGVISSLTYINDASSGDSLMPNRLYHAPFSKTTISNRRQFIKTTKYTDNNFSTTELVSNEDGNFSKAFIVHAS